MANKALKHAELPYLTQDRILRPAKVLVVLDAPLGVEMASGKAFSAPSLKSGMFFPMSNAGIQRRDVQLTYLANFQIDFQALVYDPDKSTTVKDFHKLPDHKEVYVKNFFLAALKRLKTEIALVQPSVVVLTGKWGLFFLTGETTLKETTRSRFGALLKWRGSHLRLLPYVNPHEKSKVPIVIPVLPPSSHFILGESTIYNRSDYARIKYVSDNPSIYTAPSWDIKVPEKFAIAMDILSEILETLKRKVCYVSVDIETERAYMDCLAFTIDGKHAVTIALEGDSMPLWSENDEVDLTRLMIQILRHENARLIGQNFSYDMQYFYRFWCISIAPARDTIIMQHVLSPAMKKDLATLSSMYCQYHKYWKDEGKLGQGATRMERYIYNGKDVCTTYEIAMLLDRVYKEREQLSEPLKFQTLKLLPAITRMMYRGVNVDLERRRKATMEVTDILGQLESLLKYIGLEDINFNSPTQLKYLFYTTLGATPQFSPLTGNISTGKDALRLVKEEDILYKPLVELVELFRSYSVLLRTFLRAKLDIDNKLRCLYKATGTDTYRLASTKNAFGTGLNLQNIPPEKEMAFGMRLPSIKKLIIPSEGKIIYDADLGSADARIVMGESGSQIMSDIFETGEDLYSTLAGEYYSRRIDASANKADKAIRQTFKGITHATHYLGYPAGIAARTGLLVHEVDKVQKWYFSVNPELARWHAKIKGWVDLRGYIQNVFGFRFYFINKRATAHQQAAAWIAQSSIAILINKVLVAVDEDEELAALGQEVLLQVHDSFVGEYPAHAPECRKLILDKFEIPLEFATKTVVIPADMKTSPISWGHCELESTPDLRVVN